MDYIACIQRTIDYVEEHLCDAITVDTLAHMAGFSTYHFYRIFAAYMGLPVMEYIKTRRLEHAASALAQGQRVLDIAMAFGFETHAGFTRAFRRRYHVPPEKFRRYATESLSQKPDLLKLRQQYKITGGVIMQPKIIEKPAWKAAGYAIRTTGMNNQNTKDIPAFWSAYMTDGRMDKLHSIKGKISDTEYGMCLPHDPQTDEFDYLIAIEVKDFDDAKAQGLYTCDIPAMTNAVFTTPPASAENFVQAIQSTWHYIYTEWFPKSGYQFAPNGIDFEQYDERCLGDSKSIDICIPIIKAES